LGIALIDSQGLWKLRLRQLALYGCGDLIVSFLAASTGSVATVAASVGIYRVTVAFFLLRYVLVRITKVAADVDKDMVLLALVPLVPLLLSRLVSVEGAVAQIALGFAWAAALVALYALLLRTPRFSFVYSYLRELKNRKRKSP
ncbi:MAG: hypothetical protein KJO38_06765, partial [Gammaproteobacteria bacterium]|nr:hypothetical protein [Gammaproteobacteria bacterium]